MSSMDYSFRPFLGALGANWFEDDRLLKRLLEHHVGPGRYAQAALDRKSVV